jgi:hypothetical protein
MRAPRVVVLTAAVVAAAAAGVASASALMPTAGSETVGDSAAYQPDGRAVHLSPAVPDPQGGPGWAVRVYRSQTGLTCPEAGRVEGDAFGPVDARGHVAGLSVQAAGACVDLTKEPFGFAVARYPARDGQAARSAIYGVATPDVRRVTVVTASAKQPVAIDDSGAFIAVAPSLDTPEYVLQVDTVSRGTLEYPVTRRQ